jgi:hypothetical protein
MMGHDARRIGLSAKVYRSYREEISESENIDDHDRHLGYLHQGCLDQLRNRKKNSELKNNPDNPEPGSHDSDRRDTRRVGLCHRRGVHSKPQKKFRKKFRGATGT